MLSVSLFCSIFACFTLVQSLPTGAPALACTSMRPEHALHQPKPLEERPFFVSARLDPFHAGRVLGKNLIMSLQFAAPVRTKLLFKFQKIASKGFMVGLDTYRCGKFFYLFNSSGF